MFVRSCASLALALSALAAVASAHKTVVSPYTFHRDVLPILEARCAVCHADGGIAFPLATYAQATAAKWPIQQALISGRMPVWDGDSQTVPFKGSRAISAKDLNILMTWAAGSTPEGLPADVSRRRPRVETFGPSTTLEMPEPFTLAADRQEADREVTWPAGTLEGTWIATADVVPGSPSIVRHAGVVIRSAAGEQIVRLWIPGDTPQPLAGGGAFRVPSGASIVLRIHYQRPAGTSIEVTDRSRVRLYPVAPAIARPVGEFSVEGSGTWPYGTTLVFMRPVDAPLRIAAIRPVSGPIDGRVAVTVITPTGDRVPLARVVLRPEWPRRYAFITPIAVRAGSRIEAAVTASYGVAMATLTGERPVGPSDGGPFRFVLETVH